MEKRTKFERVLQNFVIVPTRKGEREGGRGGGRERLEG